MTEKITTEKAQQFVEEERNTRARACLTEIMQVAERHRCQVEALAYITAEGRVLARLRVMAR